MHEITNGFDEGVFDLTLSYENDWMGLGICMGVPYFYSDFGV